MNWLTDPPFVDPTRIGFYGVSYGGKTAMRVAPLLDRYALCICSSDFTEGVRRMTTVTSKRSFMFDDSYNVYEFNFGSVIDYAELAKLMVPRPFMVERGRSDLTSTDEETAFEYAEVERFYHELGIEDRIAIEYFDGGHTINGKGTVEFLKSICSCRAQSIDEVPAGMRLRFCQFISGALNAASRNSRVMAELVTSICSMISFRFFGE